MRETSLYIYSRETGNQKNTMVKNIIEKIEKVKEIKEELEAQIRLIYGLYRFYKYGYKSGIDFGDENSFEVLEDGKIIMGAYYEDYETEAEYTTFEKELYEMSEKQLETHFKTKYATVIKEREEEKIKSKIREEEAEEKRDRAEFKRLNEKYRGRKSGKK